MQSSKMINYDYSVAKCFAITTIILGIVGMAIGVLIAFQMAYPELNNLAGEYGTFGRLRPLHTDAVIFGFLLSGIWLLGTTLAKEFLKFQWQNRHF